MAGSTSAASSSGASSSPPVVALCASCDRCRTRKTKCDGARPCGNCAAKYLKKNKLSSIEGIDLSEFECVYSPAKRRGPVPGKASQNAANGGNSRKSETVDSSASTGTSMAPSLNPAGNTAATQLILNQFGNPALNGGDAAGNAILHNPALAAAFQSHEIGQLGGSAGVGVNPVAHMGALNANANMSGLIGVSNEEMLQALQQQQQRHQLLYPGNPSFNIPNINLMGGNAHPQAAASAQHSLAYLQQLAAVNGNANGDLRATASESAKSGSTSGTKRTGGVTAQPATSSKSAFMQQQQQDKRTSETPMETDEKVDVQKARRARVSTDSNKKNQSIPVSVQKHLKRLDKSDLEGNRLRTYYDMSINELFNLPPIPTDEEYCASLPVPLHNSKLLPRFDVAALQAARFAEISLGALVNNQVALALELSNATVMCLRECVEEPVHPSCMYDVARAYFLHGIFRSLRGDMVRYFKYRRVCLTHLNQMNKMPKVDILLAAMSFHDSWAYVIYNAEEASLPKIDDSIPPLPDLTKQKESTDPSSIVSHPMNQMWIQGPPQIFINNEAPLLARSIDALACAVRSCCDQANARFAGMANEMNGGSNDNSQNCVTRCTPTQSAVMSNENELCSRNMVRSSFSLLQQSEASSNSTNKNYGLHVIISAMDAFLENGDDDEGGGGFTDSQIQSLLSVCNSIIEYPLLLHQCGPVYHMVSNATILLCHLLNGMYANILDNGCTSGGEMEAALFDEVLDTFIAVRKLLNTHRRKLPVRLRCHGIPRPNFIQNRKAEGGSDEEGTTFIDLGETLMCGCLGCQGFVLMACSPCVAAEKAQAARLRQEVEIREEESGATTRRENESSGEMHELDQELYDLGAEFDLDDDALLNVLSRIIAS